MMHPEPLPLRHHNLLLACLGAMGTGRTLWDDLSFDMAATLYYVIAQSDASYA
jgi:hypothetical protein